ncbi:MAG: hypothetical protein ABIQ60_10760 [Burkholderiaceae bacterium]
MSTMPSATASRLRLAALGFVFLWFLIGGIAHFVATEAEMRIVPPYVPWPRAAVLVSGGFELLGAVGLLWRPTRRAAGIGLFLLTIAVTPCHIYMLQRPELFAVPIWALWLRLPIQAALLALIAWCTVPSRREDDAASDGAWPARPPRCDNRQDG